jgi:broad-specificity NMP kinase
MNTTIITGVAGTGKTTHLMDCAHMYDFYLLHDEWVKKEFIECTSVRYDMLQMFPEADGIRSVTKVNILKWITETPERNVLLTAYWRSRFNLMLSSHLQQPLTSIIECPYLDDGIEALKMMYPDDIKIIRIRAHENLIGRLMDRNWSEDRINRTLSMQDAMMVKYEHIIDEVI